MVPGTKLCVRNLRFGFNPLRFPDDLNDVLLKSDSEICGDTDS